MRRIRAPWPGAAAAGVAAACRGRGSWAPACIPGWFLISELLKCRYDSGGGYGGGGGFGGGGFGGGGFGGGGFGGGGRDGINSTFLPKEDFSNLPKFEKVGVGSASSTSRAVKLTRLSFGASRLSCLLRPGGEGCSPPAPHVHYFCRIFTTSTRL